MYPTTRHGYKHAGHLTEFRLNTTNELLWESSSRLQHSADDVVPHAVGDGALTDYTVVSVSYPYREVMQTDGEGSSQQVAGAVCDCIPVVIVKLGL